MFSDSDYQEGPPSSKATSGRRPTIVRSSTSSRFQEEEIMHGTRLRSRSLIASSNNQNDVSPESSARSKTRGLIPPTLKLASGVSPAYANSAPLSPIAATPVLHEERAPDSSTDDSTPPRTPDDSDPIPFLLNGLPLNNFEADIKGKGRENLHRKASYVSIVMPPPRHEPHRLAAATSQRLPLETTDLPGPLPGQATIHSFAKPLGILGVLFVGSTVAIVVLVWTVPTLHLPKTLVDVLQQAKALRQYSTTSYAASLHIFCVLSCMFVWKQAFSIPGSLITNILFGSLYGVFASTIVTSLLTAFGSLLCYFMARKTSPLVRYMMPKPLAFMQSNIESRASRPSDLFSYLLLLRLFPLLPYSALNIAGGVLGIPAAPFFWTLVLGSIPFNAVTTQVGDILVQLPISDDATGNVSSIWTPALLFKLFIISFVSALPVLFKTRIKHFLGGDEAELADIDLKIMRRTASLNDEMEPDQSDEMDGTDVETHDLPLDLQRTLFRHNIMRP